MSSNVVQGSLAGTSVVLGFTATQLQGIAAAITALVSIGVGIAIIIYHFRKHKREDVIAKEALKAERAKADYYEKKSKS